MIKLICKIILNQTPPEFLQKLEIKLNNYSYEENL